MELRTTEEEVNKMVIEYKSLCQAETKLVELDDAVMNNDDDKDGDEASPNPTTRNAEEILSTLESLQQNLTTLEPKMNRFRKRLEEKDPITEKPRYGEKTANRVTTLLQTYDALNEAIRLAFGAAEDGEDNQATAVVMDLRDLVKKQQEAARLQQLEQEKLEEEQKREEQRKQEEQQLKEEQEREVARRQQAEQEAELNRRANQARQARLEAEQRAFEQEQQERLERERVDREWMDSIPKGPDGVKKQLAILKQATKDEEGAYTMAINALYTLFSQIVAHPEETNFRRVRRNHPKFQQDIGRFDGGKEVLIAAGFRASAIDDLPSFVSTEPNLETQMDEWSEWFNLLKATTEILEQELINSS